MYKVIRYFTDLQDNEYIYREGDTYPREGIEPTESRIAELSGKFNKQGVPLIKEVEEPVESIENDVETVEETVETEKPKKRTRRKADEE
jgi:hypothetical protein